MVFQNIPSSAPADYVVERSTDPLFLTGITAVVGVPSTLCATCTDLTLTAPADLNPANYNFRVRYNPGGLGDMAMSEVMTQPAMLNCTFNPHEHVLLRPSIHLIVLGGWI